MKNRLGHEDRKRRIEAIQENVKTQKGDEIECDSDRKGKGEE